MVQLSLPKNSKVTVKNPIGFATESILFEYVHERPDFLADQPGEYVLVVSVKSVFEEGLTEAHVTDQHEVVLRVSGPGKDYSQAGCSISSGRTSGSGLIFVMLLMLAFTY